MVISKATREHITPYITQKTVIFASMIKKPSSIAIQAHKRNHSHGYWSLAMWTHHRRINPWTNPGKDPQRKKQLSKHAAISKGYGSLPTRIISNSILVFWKYIPFFHFHGLLNDKYLDVFQPPGLKNYIKLKNHH